MIKKLAAEMFGTFAMMLVGTGSAIVDEYTNGAVTQLGISIAFGSIVFLMIIVFGRISGSHINPAVTLTLAWFRHFKWSMVLPYVISQVTGAFLASVVLLQCFPSSRKLGGTQPAGDPLEAFFLEVLLAFLLMFAILQCIKSLSTHKILSAGIVGAVVFFEAYLAGPFTGASMNPARSLAPAVVSGQMENIWIYLTSPIAGMLLAGTIFNKINQSNHVQEETPVRMY